MSNQVLIQFRADRALRQDCAEIYEAMGLDLNTAFRMFMERTRMVRGLPFPATLPDNKITRSEAMTAFRTLREQASDVPNMTLDEINSEITEVRRERNTP